ncbi:DUF1398 family protein [uncultured Mucilaginibacter sp.]|uniref:DUF1398 family protein n=1 Tax=uncultured Mucilaginibacter sp. TaxID=797541 RepID=UPI0025CE783C|nr:DUF1398 family protein [uncultured Mucilaginibacter sp.]
MPSGRSLPSIDSVKSDFLTFCLLVADAGVQKWVVDTQAMMCVYYDLAGNNMVAEPIPESGY